MYMHKDINRYTHNDDYSAKWQVWFQMYDLSGKNWGQCPWDGLVGDQWPGEFFS